MAIRASESQPVGFELVFAASWLHHTRNMAETAVHATTSTVATTIDVLLPTRPLTFATRTLDSSLRPRSRNFCCSAVTLACSLSHLSLFCAPEIEDGTVGTRPHDRGYYQPRLKHCVGYGLNQAVFACSARCGAVNYPTDLFSRRNLNQRRVRQAKYLCKDRGETICQKFRSAGMTLARIVGSQGGRRVGKSRLSL